MALAYALPVTAPGDLAPLAAAGAAEFYCGYMDAGWAARWGNHDSISRRQGNANVRDPAMLQAIVGEAKRLGTPLWLTLNGRYSPQQLQAVRELAALWGALGGTGLILRDVPLLASLRGCGLRLCVSLLAGCANADTLAFLCEKGAERVVLPRAMTFPEIAAMHKSQPQCELEAMVMGDPCPMTDGYCRCIHSVGYLPRQNGMPAERTIETCDLSGAAGHLCHALYGASRQPGCAACALPQLEACGVSVGKFGGRGTPLQQRLAWLTFLAAGSGGYPAAHAASFGPCLCYYPPSTKP